MGFARVEGIDLDHTTIDLRKGVARANHHPKALFNPHPPDANAPLLNLAPEALLSELTADYLHAQLCNAALHAFAAENEARMEPVFPG
jgi:F0F1-type ATP synthase gamma subunit